MVLQIPFFSMYATQVDNLSKDACNLCGLAIMLIASNSYTIDTAI